ncbi:MAG: hypothetical protein LAT67_09280 [Balneolales bacterium]|nr:hypothetical protein [Balneolales bacterium]
MPVKKLSYRFDRLPVIFPYHYRANNHLTVGDLVYYGPCPEYYGIGEILNIVDDFCIVDFRGTGSLSVHKEAFELRYMIPIHKLNLSHLLTGADS